MANLLTRKIKIELLKADVTQKQIAEDIGVCIVSVNDVVHGRRRTPRVRKAIATAVNKPVSELWPEPSNKEDAA